MILTCHPESGNRFGRNAVLVKCPPLNELPQAIWDSETRGRESRSARQTVREIAGQRIGRVPKQISRVISEGLREGWVKRAAVVHIGGFIHDGSVRGGGPKLKCVYMLYIQPSSRVPQVAASLKPHVDTNTLYL